MINSIIHHGDCLEKLKGIDNDSIDSIVTDPPYGYSFMGKDWDKAVVSVDIWKECIRVLKSGAFAFIMSSPRQDVLSRMIVNLQDAGFETNFTSIYWTYASGFPKAANVSKLIDKRLGAKREIIGYNPKYKKGWSSENSNDGWKRPVHETNNIRTYTKPTTEQAKKLDGSYAGFQPKPAVEVILVVMKPLSEKSFIDQALDNGKGITWLDDVRIPFQNEKDKSNTNVGFNTQGFREYGNKFGYDKIVNPSDFNIQSTNEKGRFPANLVVSDDSLNDGKITKSTGGITTDTLGKNVYGKFNPMVRSGAGGYKDEGSYSRYFDLDSWYRGRFPANLIVSDDSLNDGKISKSHSQTQPKMKKGTMKFNGTFGHTENTKDIFTGCYPDEGSYSRYFDLDNWYSQRAQFIITPKASASERNKGCEDLPKVETPTMGRYQNRIENGKITNPKAPVPKIGNHHPTVKPIKLMSYLITMGSRENDIILDPFCGSGTTLIAAHQLHRRYIGIELNKEYVDIANKRLEPYLRQCKIIE